MNWLIIFYMCIPVIVWMIISLNIWLLHFHSFLFKISLISQGFYRYGNCFWHPKPDYFVVLTTENFFFHLLHTQAGKWGSEIKPWIHYLFRLHFILGSYWYSFIRAFLVIIVKTLFIRDLLENCLLSLRADCWNNIYIYIICWIIWIINQF